VSVDARGRTIFVADAHRDDGKRFVVHADEKLTALWKSKAAPVSYQQAKSGRPDRNGHLYVRGVCLNQVNYLNQVK
jgi:hypothetical protein